MKRKLLVLSIFILFIFNMGLVCAADDTSDLSDSDVVQKVTVDDVIAPVEESQNEYIVEDLSVEQNNSLDVSYSSLDEKDEKILLGSSYAESDATLQDTSDDNNLVFYLEAKDAVIRQNSEDEFYVKLNYNSDDIDFTPCSMINLEIYTGNDYEICGYFMNGNKLGIYLSDLSVGKHKIIISGRDWFNNGYSIEPITVYITILPEKEYVGVKAPKVTNKNLKIKVTDKSTKKGINGVLIKLKVYTGKKYKTYKVKTNKKGVATFNTGKLSDGKHKIIITSGNKIYVMKKVKTYFTAKPHKLKVGKYSLWISNKNWQYIKTHKLKKGEWGPIKKFKTKYYRKYTWYSYPTKIITKTKRKLYIHTWYANGGIQQRVYDSALDTPSGWKYSGQKIVSKYHDSKHYIIYKKKVEVDKEVKHRSKARVYFNVWGRGPKVYVMAYCGHRGGIYKSKSVRLKI